MAVAMARCVSGGRSAVSQMALVRRRGGQQLRRLSSSESGDVPKSAVRHGVCAALVATVGVPLRVYPVS